MTASQSPDWQAFAAKWISSIAMALVTAYSAHPVLTVGLQVLSDLTQSSDEHFMILMLGGLVVVFIATLRVLLPKEDTTLRIELGARWSGILLWLTIPVMIVIIFLQAAAEKGGEQGGATAAFFMLLIFGGYCAIMGSIALIVAFVLKRRRLARASAYVLRH